MGEKSGLHNARSLILIRRAINYDKGMIISFSDGFGPVAYERRGGGEEMGVRFCDFPPTVKVEDVLGGGMEGWAKGLGWCFLPPHPSLSVQKRTRGASTIFPRALQLGIRQACPKSLPWASVFLAVRLGIDREGRGNGLALFVRYFQAYDLGGVSIAARGGGGDVPSERPGT